MRKTVDGIRGNHFLLEVQFYNELTDTMEKYFLDAIDPYNAAGRWINDACTYTDKEWPGMPHSLKTPYFNNCEYDYTCSSEPHPFVELYFVYIRATVDIPQGAELFAEYGVD